MLGIGRIIVVVSVISLLFGCAGPSDDQALKIVRNNIENGKVVGLSYDRLDGIRIESTKTSEFGNIVGSGRYYFKIRCLDDAGRLTQEIWNPIFEKQDGQWVLVYLYYIEEQYPYEWVQREILPIDDF